MCILERNSSTKAAFTTRSMVFGANLRRWVHTGVCERLFCSVVFGATFMLICFAPWFLGGFYRVFETIVLLTCFLNGNFIVFEVIFR